MDMLAVAGAAVTAATAVVLLKQYKPEFSASVSLIAGIAIFMASLAAAVPIFKIISVLFDESGVTSEYGRILFKCLGLCFITQLAADTCRDCNASSIASKVETAGRIAMLAEASPLFIQIFKTVKQLISV